MGKTAQLEEISLPQEHGPSGEAAEPFNEIVTPCLVQISLPHLQTPTPPEQKIPSSSPVSISRNSSRLSWVSDRIITPLRLFGISKKTEDTSKVLQVGETPPSCSSSPLSGRFELHHLRVQQVTNLHNAFGHPCNVSLLAYLKNAGVNCKYLKRYILAHTCPSCDANLGRRSSIPAHTPNTPLTLPAIPAIMLTQKSCTLRVDCTCDLCAACQTTHTPCQERAGCKCSRCISFYDKQGDRNEVLASSSISQPTWKRPATQQWHKQVVDITPQTLFNITDKLLQFPAITPKLHTSRDWPESVTGLQASSSPSSSSRNGGRISWLFIITEKARPRERSIKPKLLFSSSKKAQFTQREPAAAKDLAEKKGAKQGKHDPEPPPPLSTHAVSTKVSNAFLNLLRSPCFLLQATHTSITVNSGIMSPQ